MRLTVDLGPDSHDVILKRGVLGRAGLLANLGGRVLILCGEGLPERQVRKLARQCAAPEVIRLPEGGPAGFAGLGDVLARMAALGFTNGDAVAALGGSRVNDLACFTAGLYLGGIACYRFPTTVFSQADSAIGGLARLDLNDAPGLVALTRQPAIVLADPDLLDTLPPRHFSAGLAAVLRVALVGDAALLELLEQEDVHANIEKLLFLAMRFKKDLVEQDPLRTGAARLLDFSQPLARGIYAAANGALLRGESLALGMLPLLESRTLQRRCRALMRKWELPRALPCTPQDAMDAVRRTGPVQGGLHTVARVKQPGRGYLENLTEEELGLLLAELPAKKHKTEGL